MPIDYQPLEENHLAALSALFRLVYNRERSPAHYRWKFLAPLPPFQGPRMWVAVDGPTLIACAGMLTYPFWCEGRLHLGVTTCEYHTHPDYRRRGLVSDLQQKLFDDLLQQDAIYAMALPNQNLAPLLEKTGYQTQFHVRWHTRPTAWWRRMKWGRGPRRRVRPLHADTPDLDAQCDALWARLRDHVGAGMVLTGAWIRYRYLACPTHTYDVLLAEDDHGPSGLLVTGVKNIGKRQETVIATYHVRDDDPETLAALLAEATRRAARARRSTLRAIVSQDPGRVAAWRALGFRETPHGYPLAVCPLAVPEVPAPMRDAARYRVHLGDHDFI